MGLGWVGWFTPKGTVEELLVGELVWLCFKVVMGFCCGGFFRPEKFRSFAKKNPKRNTAMVLLIDQIRASATWRLNLGVVRSRTKGDITGWVTLKNMFKQLCKYVFINPSLRTNQLRYAYSSLCGYWGLCSFAYLFSVVIHVFVHLLDCTDSSYALYMVHKSSWIYVQVSPKKNYTRED